MQCMFTFLALCVFQLVNNTVVSSCSCYTYTGICCFCFLLFFCVVVVVVVVVVVSFLCSFGLRLYCIGLRIGTNLVHGTLQA